MERREKMYLIVEDKIKEAIENGEFDNLPGKGKALNLKEDLQGLSPEIRRAYRILKQAGYIPEEVDAKKDTIQMDDLMHFATDGQVKNSIQKQNQFQAFVHDRKLTRNSKFKTYAQKIKKKFF